MIFCFVVLLAFLILPFLCSMKELRQGMMCLVNCALLNLGQARLGQYGKTMISFLSSITQLIMVRGFDIYWITSCSCCFHFTKFIVLMSRSHSMLSLIKGAYSTSDGARRDGEGDYRITGRMEDILVINGHELGSAEIENVLVSHIFTSFCNLSITLCYFVVFCCFFTCLAVLFLLIKHLLSFFLY